MRTQKSIVFLSIVQPGTMLLLCNVIPEERYLYTDTLNAGNITTPVPDSGWIYTVALN